MALLTIRFDASESYGHVMKACLDTPHRKFCVASIVPKTASPAILRMLVEDSLKQLCMHEEVLKLLTPTLPEA